MVETKDVIGWVLICAGWGLAAYQYFRNETYRQPLVVFKDDRYSNRTGCVSCTMTVYNRGPWEVEVGDVWAVTPLQARIMLDPASPPSEYQNGPPLKLRLKPYSTGAFPSESTRLSVLMPDGALRCEISVSLTVIKSATASRRLTVRHSIQIQKSKTDP